MSFRVLFSMALAHNNMCAFQLAKCDQLINYLTRLVKHLQSMRYDLLEDQYQTLETISLVVLSQIRRMVHTDSFTGMTYRTLLSSMTTEDVRDI